MGQQQSHRLASGTYHTLRALRRGARDVGFRTLHALVGRPPAELPRLDQARRILLVYLNHRLGNTLLVTPAVAALRAQLPSAEIDFLGSPVATPVLAGLGVNRVWTAERWRLASPPHALALCRALRSRRYDVAIHLGFSGRSLGAVLTGLSGATHRIGCVSSRGNLFFTSVVQSPRARHKVDAVLEYLSRLGVAQRFERVLHLSEAERSWAAELLESRLAGASGAAVGIFVGARAFKGKGWPIQSFAHLARELRERGVPLAVFLGPEERPRAAAIRAALGDAAYVEGYDIRRIAALLSQCRVVVSPDSGPMHLAIAAGARTVGIFSASDPRKWGPRPPSGESVVDPAGEKTELVLETVLRLHRMERVEGLAS